MATKPLAQIWKQLGIPADYATRRHLQLQREARRLVSVGQNPEGRALKLSPRTAAAWHRMKRAAANDGVELQLISGFRSIARQSAIVRRKLAGGQDIAAILRFVAAPGCSEHHTGRALDLGFPGEPALDESFARTAAYRWLKRHAGKFGFRLSYPRRNPHGIAFEPWHWCWHSPAGRE
jgi:D-alanyl-D-alanine carboxypeptidase